jgi:serine protease
MRKPGATTIAAAAIAAAFFVPSAAQAAAPCTSSYGSAGAAGSTYPNDPLYSKQWGLGQIRAPQAWGRGGTGAGTTIAIVDTGIDLGHPDLSAKLVAGTDLAGDQPCTPGQDREGHGTHVAGIAAASTGNGTGGAGTAPDASLMPVRVLDSTGSGSSDDVSAGIRWAADHGAHVINLSLGDGISIAGLYDVPLPADISGVAEAVDYAWAHGAVVVAAAGNSSFPFCSYPGASVHAVCVAATDSTGFPSSYSNFPVSPEGGVAVRAPGGDGSGCGDGDIWSSYWPGAGDDSCGAKGYEPLAGTSMATPFVSGVAAMLRGGGLTNQQTVDCLKRTSSNGGSYDPVNGYGIVNAEAAVAGCTTLKPGPTTPTPVTPSGQSTTPGGQPPSQGDVAGDKAHSDTTAPRIALAFPKPKAHVARAGFISVRVRVSERARVMLRITSGRQTAAGGRNAVVLAQTVATLRPGTQIVKVKLTKTGRKVMRARRAMTVTLLALARDAAGNDGTAIAEGRIRR